jgi:hypothetical protein
VEAERMTTPDAALTALALQVADMREEMAALVMRLSAVEEKEGKRYRPRDSPKWWDITEESREAEIARLRGWVRDVLGPVFGHSLPDCWTKHRDSAVRVDVMTELFMVLWLSRRTGAILSAQAEYMLRVLPGLVEQVQAVGRSCGHSRPQAVAS